MKKVISIGLVFIALVLTGCSDSTLQKVSRGLLDVSQGVATLQTTIIEANRQSLVSVNDTEVILRLSFRINQAGQQASEATRALTKLSAVDKAKVLSILQPLIQEVNIAVQTGTLGITDAATKGKVQLVLQTIQTALNSLNLVLASTGGK